MPDDAFPPEPSTSYDKSSTETDGREELLEKIVQLEKTLRLERSKVQLQIDTAEQQHATEKEETERILKEKLETIERLETELNLLKQRKEIVEKMKQKIHIIDYNGITKEVMHDFLLPRFRYFVSRLKAAVPSVDADPLNQIMNIDLMELDNSYQLKVQGFPEHHAAFEEIMTRILTLYNYQRSKKQWYEQHLNEILHSINKALFDVKAQTQTISWRKYTEIFKHLLYEKAVEYKSNFNNSIKAKATQLTEAAIDDSSMPPSRELDRFIDTFIEKNPFGNETEKSKYQAMEEFIQQYITSQIVHLNKRPRPDSIQTLNIFLDRIKNQLRTNPNLIGSQVEHFKLILNLLKQILIYHSCFLLQLPLFDESIKLLHMIEANTVTTIATSTGSGKE